MDNFQKIEQLVNKAGCSYEEAKAALEGCGWDLIDAIISLERDGKVRKETEAGQTADAAEEPIEIIPEVKTESDSDSGSQGNTYRNDDADRAQDASGNSENAEGKKHEFRLWKRIKRIMINNRMVILRSNGQQIIDLPIVVPVIALLVFFWATLVLAVVAMIFGCHFHFEGEDLGKTNINSTMDKATDYAEKVKNDLTKKANGR